MGGPAAWGFWQHHKVPVWAGILVRRWPSDAANVGSVGYLVPARKINYLGNFTEDYIKRHTRAK